MISHTVTRAESSALRNVAIGAARSVEKSLRESFRTPVNVDFKRDRRDVVTVHDRAAERDITQYIFDHVPDSQLLGEEGGTVGDGRVEWFVDPIDGTSNFADGIAFWCVSIAAVVDGQVVAAAILNPTSGDLFSADLTGAWLGDDPLQSTGAEIEADATLITGYPSARDLEADGNAALLDFAQLVTAFKQVRRPGSAALSLMHVAAGWADAAAGFAVNSWDVCAAQFIIAQAGGSYTPVPVGQPGLEGPAYLYSGYVATAGSKHYPTIDAVAKRISERRE